MAEDTRRSFDLKSWQGLTEVLKIARESNLVPSVYAEFRNLVLQYAQEKGSNPALKEKIESMMAGFGAPASLETAAPILKAAPEEPQPAPVHREEKPLQGRRPTPTFMPPNIEAVAKEAVPVTEAPLPTPPITEDQPKSVAEAVEMPVVSVVEKKNPASSEDSIEHEVPRVHTPPPPPAEAAALKTIEQHRVRIMEIKRSVNSLVGNPITLMDHGNTIGRDYMRALLDALKATSPGSTQNVETAMATLETAYKVITNYTAQPHTEEAAPETSLPAVEAEPLPDPAPVPEPIEERAASFPEPEPTSEVPVLVPEPLPAIAEDPMPAAEPMPVSEPEPVLQTEKTPVAAARDERWTEAGGDMSMESQVRELRKELKSRETELNTTSSHARPLIPSLLDMEEMSVPPAAPHAEVRNTVPVDELSTESLAHRSESPLTGITLGTPQGDLMEPGVTAILNQILHEWNIFASSGLFGLGPSGSEHPLYIKIARLPMAEVLSGRFEGGDRKLVHVIKDYVDGWRHEQGIAYNPTETFEHYLRRVAQRIMKRQNSAVAV